MGAKTAVYLRQSKDKNGNELAISRQRDDCLKLCRDKAWTNIKEYPDNDRSATNGKRRERYQEMLTDIENGAIDKVVVWDLDRLHRQPTELEHFMKLADEHKLRLATVTGDCDLSSDNGRLYARIKGAVAMSEVERKSARQKAASKQRAEETGRPWWPTRPFGYDADRDAETGRWWTIKENPTRYNVIRLHPIEAPLVKQAYRAFLAGSSLRSIAAKWNEDGVLTPRGNSWSGPRVRELLVLARYAGLREYNGELVMEKDKDGNLTGKPRQGTWPAIVTEDTWRMAHTKLTKPSRRIRSFNGRKYLLSGIARCGVCAVGWQDKKGVYHGPADVALTSHISSRGKRQYACYVCHKVSRDGLKVDELIIETVVRRLSREDAVELLATDEEVDRDALVEQRRALKDRLAQLGRDFANAPPEFTQSALSDINDKLAEINAVLDDPGKARVFEGVIGADDVREAFDSLDLGRQRTIVNALMAITIKPVGKATGRVFDPNSIKVRWK